MAAVLFLIMTSLTFALGAVLTSGFSAVTSAVGTQDVTGPYEVVKGPVRATATSY